MGNIPRSVSAGHFLLELEGVNCGFAKSVEGGDISAEVVIERAQPGTSAKKHIANVTFEPFALGVDLGMHQDVYDWIADSWAGKASPRGGAVVEVDQRFDERARREFEHALITETSFAALDAAAKTPWQLTVKFAPEHTKTQKGGGSVRAGASTKQKQFVASNFRFELDGLETKQVTKIDAFTVKQSVLADPVGMHRDFQRTPGPVEFPNLRVTIAETAAQTWTDWFDDFVVKGNSGDDREKHGAIVFLDPTLKRELARIELEHVGIFALRRTPAPAGDQVRKFSVELYVESMKLNVSKTELADEPELAAAQS